MSRPEERKLNNHLRQAAAAITPDYQEKLWNTPVEKADGDAWFLRQTEPDTKRIHHYIRWAGVAAACFAVFFLIWFQVFRSTDTTVFLDVNPSITLDVNRFGKVIRAKADNQDGRIILDDMDLRGTEIDVAMNALLGSMFKHGYLSQAQNILLISVNGKDEARTIALRQRISTDAEHTLETLLGSGVVLEQTIDPDDDAEDIAEQYGISPGKAALILRLMNDQPSWSIQELAAMPMSDLIRHCQAAGIDISHYLGEDGEIIGDLDSLFDDDDEDDDFDDEDDFDDKDDDFDDDFDDETEDDDFDDDEESDEPDDRDEPDDKDEPDEDDKDRGNSDEDDEDEPDEDDSRDEAEDDEDDEEPDDEDDSDDKGEPDDEEGSVKDDSEDDDSNDEEDSDDEDSEDDEDD